MGPREIIVIAIVVVLLFGAPKLPQLARAIGKSMRILKDETKSLTDDDKQTDSAAEAKSDDKSAADGGSAAFPNSTMDASSLDNERRDKR